MPQPASFYLGPRRSRLRADTWDEIVTAAAAGVLDESQWVELKQAVPSTSRPANLELAKDLASLSVDGGVLIVGIADAGGAAGEVVGTDVASLQTRITQVATGRISPALPVVIGVITKPGKPDVGLVVVTVPASEGAPHMVAGQYWGRDAQGKRALSDDEVRRLLADRQSRAAGFTDRLHAVPSQLDPPDLGSRGRLYLLLEPAAAASEPLIELLAGAHPLEIMAAALPFRPQWSPSFLSLNYRAPHPDGTAAASVASDAMGGADHEFLYVLLADDGTVKVSAPAARPYGAAAEAPDVLSPGQLLETIHSATLLAGHLATKYTGYHGHWRAGLHLTRLRGLLPSQARTDFGFQRFHPFPAAEYTRTTQTSTPEMLDQTAAVVTRLTTGLLRGLGVEQRFLPYDDPADLSRRS